MNKEISYSPITRKEILDGAEMLYNAVKATYGPLGKNALIQKENEKPFFTKDGATVAENFSSDNPHHRIGMDLLRDACLNTMYHVGDGTSSTVVLAFTLFKRFNKLVEAGYNPNFLISGIKIAQRLITLELDLMTKFISEYAHLYRVAMSSSNGDELMSRLVVQAVEKMGDAGSIAVDTDETEKENKLRLDVEDGYKVDLGYVSPYFLTNGENQMEFENPYILITDLELTDPYSILPLMNEIASQKRALIVIAADYSEQVKSLFIINNQKGMLKSCLIYAPGFQEERYEFLEDLCLFTGAKYLSEKVNSNLNNLHLDLLGSADKVSVNSTRTLVLKGAGNIKAVQARIQRLERLYRETFDDKIKSVIETRIGKLKGLVVSIVVGGLNKQEILERKDRLDDTLSACMAAQLNGVLPGGGTALLKAVANVYKKIGGKDIDNITEFIGATSNDVSIGLKTALECSEELFYSLFNGRKDIEAIKTKVLEDTNTIFDIRNEEFVDYEYSLQDPYKVVREVLEGSFAIAENFLKTEACVYNVD